MHVTNLFVIKIKFKIGYKKIPLPAYLDVQNSIDYTITSRVPVSLLNCSPNAITGRAEAKKIYAVGANILV